jgi:hypothetical protein
MSLESEVAFLIEERDAAENAAKEEERIQKEQ